MRPSILGLDIAAFSGLKRLHLRLAHHERSAPENCDNIEGLLKRLGSMHSLRRLDLELSLSYTEEDHLSLFRCDQVFTQVTTWQNLEAMNLHNFASSAYQPPSSPSDPNAQPEKIGTRHNAATGRRL